MQSQYAYVLSVLGEIAVFTWPNAAKKYIRDVYTTDGELHLPPPAHISLYRYKVNPKAGHYITSDWLDVEDFLNG